MLTTKLRQVGDTTMIAVPPDLLRMPDLQAGDSVTIMVESGRLVMEPSSRTRYTLAGLLAESDYSEPPSAELRAWLDMLAIGRELP